MDKAALVGIDVAAGKALLDALDADGMDVRAAYWRLYDEEEPWRLYLVIGTFDMNDLFANDRQVREVLIRTGSPLTMSDVFVTTPNDYGVKQMVGVFDSDPKWQNWLVGPYHANATFIYRAYIYRLNS